MKLKFVVVYNHLSPSVADFRIGTVLLPAKVALLFNLQNRVYIKLQHHFPFLSFVKAVRLPDGNVIIKMYDSVIVMPFNPNYPSATH